MMNTQIAVYTFSNIDLVHQCLIDKERLHAYQLGIREAIKIGCKNALDIGTGTGVLALMAASEGAASVAAVEVDPYLCTVASNVFLQNAMSEVILLIQKDIRQLTQEDLEGRNIDLVTIDLITTGLIDEYQIEAINALHQNGIVNNKTVFVPNRQISHVRLVETDFQIYGFEFPIIRHIWKQLKDLNPKVTPLSLPELLSDISYTKEVPTKFNKTIEFMVNAPGVFNSILINSETWINNEIFLQDTESLNAPVVVPVDRQLVNPGDKISLNISYEFGQGFGTLVVTQNES